MINLCFGMKSTCVLEKSQPVFRNVTSKDEENTPHARQESCRHQKQEHLDDICHHDDGGCDNVSDDVCHCYDDGGNYKDFELKIIGYIQYIYQD